MPRIINIDTRPYGRAEQLLLVIPHELLEAREVIFAKDEDKVERPMILAYIYQLELLDVDKGGSEDASSGFERRRSS